MEFALVVPALLLLLVTIMEFGYAFFIQSSVAAAARSGVRNYSINWTVPNAADTAISVAKSALPNPSALASASITTPCTAAGKETTMVLTYTYHSLTGALDGIFGNTLTVTGKGTMACGG